MYNKLVTFMLLTIKFKSVIYFLLMKNFPTSKILIKWLLILATFLIVTSILWNTNQFFKNFKKEECRAQ